MRLPTSVYAALPALFLVLALPWCGEQSGAQSDMGGTVVGRVTGPDGRGVRGALVRIENPATGDHTDVTTDAGGNFRLMNELPGQYRLEVRARGLSAWEGDNLAVGLGTVTRLDPALASLSQHRTVLVDAGRSANQAGAPSDVGQGILQDLPNNGQHWSSLAALFGAGAPDGSGGMSLRGLSPLLNSIGVDGMNQTLAFRGRERGTAGNGFATAQSAVSQFRVAGSVADGPGRRAVASMTKSGGSHMRGQATFYDRGALGQTFNAYDKVMQMEPAGTTVTAAGQPVMYLNGQPITYVEVPWHVPDRRQQWEVSAGGPIRRERAFWFFVWEQHNRSDPAVARASEPEVFFFAPSEPTLTTLEARLLRSQSPIAARCAGTGVPGGGSTAMAACAYATVLNELSGMLGAVPRSTHQTLLFPKIDWRLNARNQLTVQYNAMRRTSPHGALGGASETVAVGSFGNSSSSDDAAVLRWDDFATPRLVNSLRYQFSRDVLAQSPAATDAFAQQFAANSWGLPPQVSVDASQGFSFGTLDTVNKRQYPAETRQQVADTATWMRGRQTLRAGYDFNHVRDALDGVSGENGEYSYATLLNFISDMLAPDSCDGSATASGTYPCYSRFRQTVGYTKWWFSTEDVAGYAADDWKFARGLTVSLGLRYDYEHLPNTNAALVNEAIPQTARLPHNVDEFGPRAGFAWDLFGGGHTVLRGGFGIWYGRVPNAMVFSALNSTGTARSPRAYAWRSMDEGAPPFPYVFSSTETPYTDLNAPDQASTAPEVVYFDPHFRHPQINQADVALEQQIGRKTTLIVTGMATDGHHLTQFIDTNIDPAAVATVFYTVKAPGNGGNVGPLAKASTPVTNSAWPIYQPRRFYYQRLNRAYGSITDIVSETNSTYRGAMVRLVRSLSRTLTVNAGYTWAHTLDDNQNEATFAERDDVYDPADLLLEHGTSNFDVRQRVAGGVVLRTPWRLHGMARMLLGGYSLAAAGDWRTGLPYTMRTLGAVPTPECSYQAWLVAGGATGDGPNCLKSVQQPGGVIVNGGGVPIASLGASLNGSGGEDLIPGIGRNTFRYPATANLDLRFTKTLRLSERYSFEIMGDVFNTLNHQNVTNIQTVGYRVSNDTQHANMAALTWQSGETPATTTVMVNGASVRQYAYDPTAAFGGVTSANSMALSRERELQLGIRLHF